MVEWIISQFESVRSVSLVSPSLVAENATFQEVRVGDVERSESVVPTTI